MNINFNEVTWEKLLFLANSRGVSVAALVSEKMDEFTGQLVNVQYSLNVIPEGTREATAPSFMLLPSDVH